MNVENTLNRCPDCGGPVESDLACHTYPQTRTECSANERHGIRTNSEGEYHCLDCGGTVKTRTTWMSCMPCDSATYWFCTGDAECHCSLDTGVIDPDCYYCDGTGIDEGWGCGWRYTQGLNPGNPRSEENETHRPEWL